MKMLEDYEKLITNNSVKHQLLQYRDKGDVRELFQYRSFSGFWSIIKSDSIWARNIRFSNDNQEQKQGLEILKMYYSKQKNNEITEVENTKPKINEAIEDEQDYFMVCFCEQDDVLSQWRGYAPEGGVSMSFEINSQLPYEIVSDNDKFDVVLKPHQVIYLDKNNEDEYEQIFKDISANENRFSPEKNPKDNELSLVPYLKDKGFIEEKEWRVIISEKFNNIDSKTLRKFIKFQKIDDLEIPYVVIKAGNTKLDKFPSKVKLQIYDGKIREKIFKDLSEKNITVIDCYDGYINKIDCVGCTKNVKMYQLGDKSPYEECRNIDDYLGINKFDKSIVITQGYDQEEIFELIDTYVKNENIKDIKVWCEGHLPIRRVTVSPCENRDYIVENIKNYFKNSNQYWLRYVDVNKSNIPYRSKLK